MKEDEDYDDANFDETNLDDEAFDEMDPNELADAGYYEKCDHPSDSIVPNGKIACGDQLYKCKKCGAGISTDKNGNIVVLV